jgi:hypothetical protein
VRNKHSQGCNISKNQGLKLNTLPGQGNIAEFINNSSCTGVNLKRLVCIVFSLFVLTSTNNVLAQNYNYGGYKPPTRNNQPPSYPQPSNSPSSQPSPVASYPSQPNNCIIQVCEMVPVYQDPETGLIYKEEVCQTIRVC